MKNRVPAALSISVALALGVTACSGSSAEEDAAPAADPGVVAGVTVTGEFGEEPTIEVDGLEVEEPLDGVAITGDGAEVTAETVLNYRFRMVLASSGEDVSSNYSEEAAQELDVAQQPAVISDAIVGANLGSRVVIAMQVKDLVGAGQAKQYGMKGKDEMVMVMDLVSIPEEPLDGPDGEAVAPPADAPTVVEDEDGAVTGITFDDAPAKPSKELEVITLIEGSGEEVKEDDNLTVDYYGTVYGDGTAFDESYSAEPVAFPLTQGSLIDGWVQGLEGVTVGSRVMLVIPADLGYGDQESGSIPANSTLVFVVDVLGANL